MKRKEEKKKNEKKVSVNIFETPTIPHYILAWFMISFTKQKKTKNKILKQKILSGEKKCFSFWRAATKWKK